MNRDDVAVETNAMEAVSPLQWLQKLNTYIYYQGGGAFISNAALVVVGTPSKILSGATMRGRDVDFY